MAGGWMDKFKDYVKGNPEQAGSAIEKVEDLIDQRTGGKYADKVDKGGDVLRDKLGLPPQADQPADQPGAQPGTPPATQPGTPPATPAGPGPVEQSGQAPSVDSPAGSPAEHEPTSTPTGQVSEEQVMPAPPTPDAVPGTVPEPGPSPVPEPGPSPITEPGPAPVPEPSPSPIPEPAPEPAPSPDGPTSSGDRDAGSTQPVEGSVPVPEPDTNDPQEPGSLEEGALVPGDADRVGQPGGPMDPAGVEPTQPSQHRDGLPQGGTTQQGEPQTGDAVPGGKQPDDGGPGRG
ncbi:Rv0909 family putative TA system antitoxin [Pedococcus sp. 2YAF34]|uniref:antitoxin n=1 Tax=Pedococcus sp. 2YAF34 TaxID=3233032 RepID=UPI003F9C0D76